jgi:opine dehydrogenase
MSLKIAIIGNTGMNIGAAVAGDMALVGHDVRFLLWPDQRECLEACLATGGIHVGEPASETISGKTGLGAICVITDDPAEAIAGADLVIVDEVQLNLEARAVDFIPHLENGQVLHVNMHGYWPSFRLATMLREADKAGVTVTEGVTPTHAAARTGAHITPGFIRRTLPLASFPANRSEMAMARLSAITKLVEPCRNVIETNLESMNMLIHPAMALLNIGYYDRAEAKGERASFYGTGNTAHTGKLVEALDAERPAVCEAYGVRFRSVLDHIRILYDAKGGDVQEAVAQSTFYRGVGDLPADIWQTWMGTDLPLAHVPFVLLAENAGCNATLHRGFIDIVAALLDAKPWEDGLTLERLGLAGMDAAAMTAYAETGA